MKNGSVDQDSHLIGAKIKQNLQAVNSTGGGLGRGGCWELKLERNCFLPLKDLVIEIADFLNVQGRAEGWRVRADRTPDFGTNT